jgi:hypothetical protein
MGDIISVIDGRDTLTLECQESLRPLRQYLSLQFQALMKKTAFMDALPGHLPPDPASQDRLPLLIENLENLAELPWD